MKINIAVDGMGGDHGPTAVIPGIKKAYQDINDPHLNFLLFAPKNKVEELIKENDLDHCIHLIHTESVIDPHESPLKILRKGLKTTMGQSIQSVVDGRSHAVFSAGATGSYIALCWKLLKLLAPINKVALPAIIPSMKNYSLMLDVGASLSVSAEDLVQFSVMGNVLSENLFNIKKPRIGLLNIGTEEIKGLPYVIEANKILKKINHISYKGFVESNVIFNNVVDVIVTDGYAGNLVLKAIKGCEVYFNSILKQYLTKTYLSTFLSAGALYQIKQLKKDLDWRQFNGSPLLGFSKLAVKSHGDSDSIGIAGGLKITYNLIKSKLIEKISNQLESHDVLKSVSVKKKNVSV